MKFSRFRGSDTLAVILRLVIIILIGLIVLTFGANKLMETGSRLKDNQAQDSGQTEPVNSVNEPTGAETVPAEVGTVGIEPKKTSYQIFVDFVSWDEAERLAREKGGRLASITNQELYNAVVEQLSGRDDIRYVWVGAEAESSGGNWNNTRWLNGDMIEIPEWSEGDYNKYCWYPGEPTHYDPNDHVVEDRLCLWNAKYYGNFEEGEDIGWTFNDQRNDISEEATGKVAYIVAYDE